MSMIAILIAATACESAIDFAETCINKGKEYMTRQKFKHTAQARRYRKRRFV